nr:hypothetical protein GCM10020185_51200 [Pseudomonas brassicacearum subsp. brassicacearum]
MVEARIGCLQGALVIGQCALDIRLGHAIGVRVLEVLGIAGVIGDALDDRFPGAAHFHRAGHDRVDLFFQRVDAAIPELVEVQAGIEHGGRVDLHRLAIEA